MRQIFNYFSDIKPFIILLVISSIMGFFAWRAVQNLPKPETIPELIKYYFQSPGDYLLATALFLIVGLLFIFLSIETGFMIILNWEHLTIFAIVFCIIFTIAQLIVGIYFFSYFGLAFLTLLVIAGIAYVVIKAIGDSK